MLASERRNIPPFIETSLEILSQYEFQFDTDLVSRFQLCISKSSLMLGSDTETHLLFNI